MRISSAPHADHTPAACRCCGRGYGASPARIRIKLDGSIIWTALCADCRKLDAPTWELAGNVDYALA